MPFAPAAQDASVDQLDPSAAIKLVEAFQYVVGLTGPAELTLSRCRTGAGTADGQGSGGPEPSLFGRTKGLVFATQASMTLGSNVHRCLLPHGIVKNKTRKLNLW